MSATDVLQEACEDTSTGELVQIFVYSTKRSVNTRGPHRGDHSIPGANCYVSR